MNKKIFIGMLGIFFLNFFLLANDWKVQKELYEAIKNDNKNKTKLIIEKHPLLINKRIKYHNYPIMEAAYHCSINSLKLLVSKGANLKQLESKTKNSILHFAVENLKVRKEKREIVFDYLVKEKKLNIEITNKKKQTPFNYAFSSRRFAPSVKIGVAIIELFDKHEANLNVKNSLGKTVLNYLATGFIKDKTFSRLDIAKILIEKGVDVNISDNNKRTPLISFLVYTKKSPEKMKIDFVTLLMKNGANIKIKSKKGEKALKLVKKKGKLYKIMKLK